MLWHDIFFDRPLCFHIKREGYIIAVSSNAGFGTGLASVMAGVTDVGRDWKITRLIKHRSGRRCAILNLDVFWPEEVSACLLPGSYV